MTISAWDDEELLQLKNFTNLRILVIECEQPRWFPDQSVAVLEHLDRLRSLYLENTYMGQSRAIDDTWLSHLSGLRQLEYLFLHGQQITDAGISKLAGLTNLQILNLSRTRVGDNGLVYLTSLYRLEELDLSDTTVTESGLAKLTMLKGLRRLYLPTEIADGKAAQDLERTLPQCKVTRRLW